MSVRPLFCHFIDKDEDEDRKVMLCGLTAEALDAVMVTYLVHGEEHRDMGSSLGVGHTDEFGRCTAGCNHLRCQACMSEAIRRGLMPELARRHLYDDLKGVIGHG